MENAQQQLIGRNMDNNLENNNMHKSKIISERELAELTPLSRKSANAKSPFRAKCFALKVGQYFRIDRGEWDKAGYAKATKPSNILVGTKRRFNVEEFVEGWAVKRRV